MKKRMLSIMLVTILLITGCSKTVERPEEPSVDESQQIVSEWPFDVVAASEDGGGIEPDTEFILLADNDQTLENVMADVSISPAVEFSVIEKSAKEFVIKPQAPLEKNKIYQVKMKGRKDGQEYTWAFQTQKDLKVVNSIPGNRSEYVPVNSGIEIQFSHMGLKDVEDYIVIEPAVKGKFSSNGYSVVFIPDELERDQTYTVSVLKGLRVNGSDLALEEDYLFTFQTEPESWDKQFGIGSSWLNYTSQQNHFVPAYMNHALALNEFSVDLYAFDNSDDFIRDLTEYDRVYSFDKLYSEIPEYLNAVQSYEIKPVLVEQGYMSFYSFEIQDQLPQGYYIARISLEGMTRYAFIQVNDLLVYSSEFDDQHMFWILDSNTNEAVAGAGITVDEEFSGTTGSDGVALIPYEQDEEDVSFYDVTYARIASNEYPDFVMRNEKMIYRYYEGSIYPYYNLSNDYWKYLFTDRSTYLPTDEMNIFGYLVPKSRGEGNYKISLYSNINGYDLIDEKELEVGIAGTFTEKFEWNELSSGWYSVTVEDEETVILNHGFYINPYTKPVYKAEGSFDKDVISSGDTIAYSLTSSFFDGTPAPNMGFNYYLNLENSANGNITTDSQGNASVNFTPEYETTSWRPVNAQIELYNSNAEDQRITAYDHFAYLPKDKMIELEYDGELNTPAMKILGHEIDISKFENVYSYSYENLRGEPLDLALDLQVTEVWYDKVEKGQVYDYINKVTVKTYDYVKRTKIVEDRDVALRDGVYNLEMPYVVDSESTFEVKVTLDEGQGQKIIEEKTVNFHSRPYFEPLSAYYTLKLEDEKWQYRINEQVAYHLDSSGPVEESAQDRLLVMFLQDGLLEYEIKTDLSGAFTFTEDMIPNIYIQGIYVKDGQIMNTSYATQVRFDYTERKMAIEVSSDRVDYGPGDEVLLTVKSTDASGNPYPATINISIVDEAYFNLYSQTADMLGSLYSSVYGTGIISEYASSSQAGGMDMFRGMAEGGDGFAAESGYYVRSDFKDTATFMMVETDENGEGQIAFNLPDNLTSWRITYQGVNDKMEADTDFLNVNAKLPIFVTTIIGETFIEGDHPFISLRTFGDEAVKGETVEYNVVLSHEGDEKTFEGVGIVGEYTNIDIGELAQGDYTVTTYAKSGDLTDAVEEHFTVVDSTVRFGNITYYKAQRNMSFDDVFSNARITFFNENESTFYNSLMGLRFSYGKRVDQLISGMFARRLIQAYFEEDLELWDEPVSRYQNYDGGIKLLPYSDSDSLISARLSLLGAGDFNLEMLKGYFYGILNNSESGQGEVINALTGLATMDEPVLIEMRELESSLNLTSLEKILLALGMDALGDKKGANGIYQEIQSVFGDIEKIQSIRLSDDEGNNYLSKALLATLAVKVGDPEFGDKLFDDVYLNPSEMELASLEIMTYLENREIEKSEQIMSLSGSITVKNGSERTTFDLFGFESESMTLTKEELKNIEIEKVDGNLGIYVDATGDVEAMKKNRVDDFSIERSYSVGSEETTVFSPSDLIKVTLDPTIEKDEHRTYEMTDFIPAGFRFIKAGSGNFWYEEQGQKMVFYYWSSANRNGPVTYYIQAVMPGTYTADHAVIIKSGEVGTNYTGQEILTVE